MPMQFCYYEPAVEDVGSGYVGETEINYSYYELFDIFGKHHQGLSGDLKVEWGWEWRFVIIPSRGGGHPLRWCHATVYNWKDGPSYREGHIATVKEEDLHEKRCWHIGGKGIDAFDLVNWVIAHKHHPRLFKPTREVDANGQYILFR